MQKPVSKVDNNNDNILLSIWMVTYNHEKFISKAIESVLSQKSDFNYKLVIGEDASKDGTSEIVKRYQEQFPFKIKTIVQKENVGPYQNTIDVYKECNSKYVAMLEGDDYWTCDTKLQEQVDFLENNPQFSMCFTNSVIVDENDEVLNQSRVPEDKQRILTQTDILNGYCPPSNTVVFRGEYLKKLLEIFPRNIINGDFFTFNFITNFGDAGYINNNTAAYRKHSRGIWNDKDHDFININYVKTCIALIEFVKAENKSIVKNSVELACNELNRRIMQEDYTENGCWTPQTAMLRSIRDAVLKIDGSPVNALSIDDNPSIEKMLLRKWPVLDITKTQWPEYDAQNLHQFKDETFDIVFSHQVLEHIPKPWIAAKEMNRVLKSGGIGIHSSCAYNPRHGYPAFKDYYRFLPDGLAELFDGVNIWVKEGWGSKEALIYNLTIDDGHGQLGGRRFVETLGQKNDENYPWHTWVIFQKQ